jgi:hypothetical protein
MRGSGAWLLAALCAAEGVAWAALVPDLVLPGTFLCSNALLFGMFGVGFASAANGLPPLSITQMLDDGERTAAQRLH